LFVSIATALPKRQDVSKENTWNLETIYPDNQLWEEDFARVEGALPELTALAGTLGIGHEQLLRGFQTIHATQQTLEQLLVYSFMRRDEDTTNPAYQAQAERMSMLSAKFGSATAFFAPELLALADERIDAYLAENEELRVYSHYLNELRRQRTHVRSAEVEAVLAAAGEVTRAPKAIFDMLNDADMKFPSIRDEHGNEVEVTKGRYILLLENKDQRVRKDAFESLYSKYTEHRNTLGATLSGAVRRDVFDARVRGYESALAAALDPEAIPLQVYQNLVDTVNKNLHHYHRYLRLRKQFLGLDELHMYDLYVPLMPGATVEIPYEEARVKVEEGLAPLGDEYIQIMREGIYRQRWVDVYENEGKRGGAYSWGSYTTQPFVLLNYQNNLNNVYTLAHELGHAMHRYFTNTTQPYVYGGNSIFVAEVASTLNEALLTNHLLKTADDRALKLQIVNQQLEEYRGTLFRQTMFAEFELETHRRAEAGEALTADTFTAIYRDLLERYFGSEVVLDEQILLEWSRIPHFYRGFYVYQYATGISAATALTRKILNEGQPAVDRYLGFLRGGSSRTSIDLLRGAGVDMAEPEPIEQAVDYFGTLVGQFEELMRDMGNGHPSDA
jgi:oligoendopeptidase F